MKTPIETISAAIKVIDEEIARREAQIKIKSDKKVIQELINEQIKRKFHIELIEIIRQGRN